MKNTISTFRSTHQRQCKPSRGCFIFCLLIAGLICQAGFTNTASAATYYLDAVNGDDSNPGTSEVPWKTIARAMINYSGAQTPKVVSGDTVMVKNGDYGPFVLTRFDLNKFTGDMNEPLPGDTTWTTYQAADGSTEVYFEYIRLSNNFEGPYLVAHIFDGVNLKDPPEEAGGYYTPIRIDAAVGIRLKNMHIEGTHDPNIMYNVETHATAETVYFRYQNNDVKIQNCNISWGFKGIVISSNNLEISDCNIYNTGDDRINIGTGKNILIEGNYLHLPVEKFCPDAHPDIIQIGGITENLTFRRNRMYDHSSQGLWCSTTASFDNKNMLWENNLIYTTGNYEWTFYNLSGAIVRNNTMISSGYQGIRFKDEISNTQVYNNLFVGPYSADDADGLIYHDYNIFIYQIGIGKQPGITEEHSHYYSTLNAELNAKIAEVSAIMFNNPNANDYTLKPGCLAIDFGNPNREYPATDILGISRVFPPDAGCYEYISSDSGNSAPVLNAIGNRTINENSTLSFTVSATDADGDIITYSATGTAIDAGAALTEQSFSWTPGCSQAGSYNVTFIASDSQAQDSETITITVSNTSPIANKIEIFETWDYNEPGNSNDLRHFFFTAIETDGTVALVEFLTPAGNTFQIPKQDHTNSNGIQTWYYVDNSTHYWEYQAELSDKDDNLLDYGDGIYTYTVYYEGGGQALTSIWFGIPNTNDPIPQPTQEPVLTFPAYNGTAPSPVTFTWEPCIDANATSIWLCLEKLNANDRKDVNLPVDDTASGPIALSGGGWEAALYFDHWYDFNNIDGIPVEISKYSESNYTFTITLSPVGYWTMNDNAANTTVIDSSGNGNDGAAQQNTNQLYTTGQIQGALTFNGINDYVDCGNDSSLDITDSLTISAWVKLDSYEPVAVGHILRKENAYAFGISNTGRIGFYRKNGIFRGRWNMGATPIELYQWHHVAVTYNSVNGAKVYLDGVLDGTLPSITGAIDTSAVAAVIGRLSPYSNRFLFNGSIDNVMIFNRTLSAAEMQALYDTEEVEPDNQVPVADAGQYQTVTDEDNNGSEQINLDGSQSTDPDGTIVSYVWTEGGSVIATGVNTTVTLTVGTHTITLTVTGDNGGTDTDTVVITINEPLNQKLAGHWMMDDNAANTTVIDSSGNGNDGAAQQNTNQLYTTGQIQGALTFNGINDYVDCGNDSSLDITDSLTISAWVKLDSYEPVAVGHILRKENAYAFGISNTGRIGFYRKNGIFRGRWNMGATPIELYQWHHVAVTYNSVNGAKVYLDGVLDGTLSSITGAIDTSAVAAVIGRLNPYSNRFLFNGSIDNVMIFNRTLSEQEIETLYNEGSGI